MNKRLLSLLLAFLSILAFSLLSSSDNAYRYGAYSPVFMERPEMEKAVRAENPRELKDAGKIYIKDQYIFINEKYKGFHVIDNSNPSDPKNIAFLHIDGCLDMEMKGDVIYADNAVDLVAIKTDASFKTLQVTERIRKVLPEISAPDQSWPYYELNQLRPKNGVLVAWTKN